MNEDIDTGNSGHQRPNKKEMKSSCDTWERQEFKLHSLLKTKDEEDKSWPLFPARGLFQPP